MGCGDGVSVEGDIQAIQDDIRLILEGQVKHQGTMDAILSKFDTLVGEIKPMIDELVSGPWGRMLNLGKKKK